MVGIDAIYVKKHLKEMREALDELSKIVGSMSIDDFMRDREARFAARYSIILIVEAAADIGVAILRELGEEAESYREVFTKLAEKGVISYKVAEGMAALASLRNMVVHRYWDIDDARIYRKASKSGLEIVRRFAEEVKRYAAKSH